MGAMKNIAIEMMERGCREACLGAFPDACDAMEATNVTTPDEWADAVQDLATAATGLLNRLDCCGGYRATPVTRKDSNADWLPMPDALHCHFMGHRTIGLHSTSKQQRCRWLAFDIDSHDSEDPYTNIAAAQLVAHRLRREGLVPYIFDSDGRGGVHVWAVFDQPMESEDAYRLARYIGTDAGVKVECFPKQPRIREGGYGNWIRLPGRHPKRDVWSRVRIDGRWGTHEETVDAILEMCRCLVTS